MGRRREREEERGGERYRQTEIKTEIEKRDC